MNAHKEYIHSLDSLRFFAFLCVFVSHVFVFSGIETSSFSAIVVFLTQGNLGVSLFFVLSGFLITWLLFKEKDNKGDIAIKKFYFRRIIRIWPVYIIVLFLGMVGLPYLIETTSSQLVGINLIEPVPDNLWKYVFFAMNFYMVEIGRIPFYIAILWSISIEEQFYFIWPWVIKYFRKIKLPILFTLLIILSTFLRFNHVEQSGYVRYATLSVLSDLVIGAFGAYLVMYKKDFKTRIEHAKKYVGYVLMVSVPILFYLYKSIELVSVYSGTILSDFMYAFLTTIIGFYFLYIVLFVSYNKHVYLPKLVKETFEFLGQRSYGLYCYHAFGLLIVNILIKYGYVELNSGIWSLIVYGMISFIFTIILSIVSYSCIERPILKLKSKYS